MASLSNAYENNALCEPTFPKMAQNHPFRPDTDGLVDNAYGVMAFPFPFERRNVEGHKTIPGPYAYGSSAWFETDQRYQHADKFTAMLHLLTMALEFKDNGCPTIKGRAGSNDAHNVIMAVIRKMERRAKKEDAAIMARGIEQTLYMDQRVAEFIRAIVSGSLNSVIPGRQVLIGEGDEEDDAELQDGMEVDLYGGGGGGGGGGGRRRGGRWARDEDDDEDGDNNMDPNDEIDLRIRELMKDHLADAGGISLEGKFVFDKVMILVVHMTRPVLDDNGDVLMRTFVDSDGSRYVEPQMEDAGCVVFVLIMDPLFSAGKAFKNIIDMAEEHHKQRTGTAAQDATKSDMISRDGDSSTNRQGKRFASGQPSRLMQHFPWLGEDAHVSNAMHTMTMLSYVNLVSFVRNDPSIYAVHYKQLLARGMDDIGTDREPNVLHPINVFTPEWALATMEQYGVGKDQTRMERFRGAEYHADAFDINGLIDEDGNLIEGPAGGGGGALDLPRWYFPPEATWNYPSESWTWARNAKAGLHRQYFPWIDVPAALRRLTATRENKSNALSLFEGNTDTNVLSREYTQYCMVEGLGVITPLPELSYDPNAILRQSAIFQVASQNQRVLSEIVAPREPEKNPETYARYCKEMREMREACMMRMQQIMVPTAAVAPAFKLMFGFMAKEVRKVGTYLPHYTMDPLIPTPDVLELDSFSNYMIREAMYVRNHRMIVAQVRHWQISHHGSKDAYSLFGIDIHYCSIYYGMSQGGKSYFAKDATVNTTVEGTVTQMLESSNRSFNTHDDFTGEIIFKDELDDVYVNAKAAAADKSGKAERIKSMMSDQKATYRTLVFMDQANGRQRRVGENIETLFHASMICCTNKRVGSGGKGDEAIASRFLNFAITRAEVDLYKYLGVKNRLDDEDKMANGDFVHMLRIKQCLLAYSQALIDAGVIPEPSMDVYDTINSRMMSYMRDQGIDTTTIRGAQMTKRLARIYVILNAIIQTYDVPGAIHYDHEFALAQLADLTPHMYATKQITLFAITQTSEIYIHPLQVIVLKGMYSLCGFKFERGKTVDMHFAEDVTRTLPWRRTIKPNGEHVVDFNYFVIEGDIRNTVIPALGEHCKPRPGPNEIESEIGAMSKRFITGRPIAPVNAEYWLAMPESTIRTHKLPRLAVDMPIAVIERDFRDHKIYVAVDALQNYREDMVVDAFMNCIHDGFRKQTFLLGTQLVGKHPTKEGEEFEYTGIYKTLCVNDAAIEFYSMGPKFLLHDVSYVDGIVSEMMGGARLHPDKKDQTYEKNRTKRSKVILEIDEDLDDWGHTAHHYRAACPGLPINSPSRQVAVYNNIRAAILRIEMKHDLYSSLSPEDQLEQEKLSIDRALLLDYPRELQAAEDRRLITIKTAENFGAGRELRRQHHEDMIRAWRSLPPEVRKITPRPAEVSAADFTSNGKFHRVGLPLAMTQSDAEVMARYRDSIDPRAIKMLTGCVLADESTALVSAGGSGGGGGGGGRQVEDMSVRRGRRRNQNTTLSIEAPPPPVARSYAPVFGKERQEKAAEVAQLSNRYQHPSRVMTSTEATGGGVSSVRRDRDDFEIEAEADGALPPPSDRPQKKQTTRASTSRAFRAAESLVNDEFD